MGVQNAEVTANVLHVVSVIRAVVDADANVCENASAYVYVHVNVCVVVQCEHALSCNSRRKYIGKCT